MTKIEIAGHFCMTLAGFLLPINLALSAILFLVGLALHNIDCSFTSGLLEK